MIMPARIGLGNRCEPSQGLSRWEEKSRFPMLNILEHMESEVGEACLRRGE
jgi:hypothetical protein